MRLEQPLARLVAPLRRFVGNWANDPFRRSLNERGASVDETCTKIGARLLVLHIISFVLLKERQPGQALIFALHPLLMECTAVFMKRRRETYVRHREAIVLLLQLHHAWSVMFQIVNSNGVGLSMHNGSALGLLILNVVGCPIHMISYSLHARLLLSWNVWALPAIAVLPIAFGPRMCVRLLETEGAEAALAGAYRGLNLAHLCRSPLAALLEPTAASSPRQACVAINAWTVLFVTVVTPLCIMYPLEQRARKRFREAAEGAAGGSHLRRSSTPQSGDELRLLPLTGVWLLDAYVASCLIWSVVAAAYSRPMQHA